MWKFDILYKLSISNHCLTVIKGYSITYGAKKIVSEHLCEHELTQLSVQNWFSLRILNQQLLDRQITVLDAACCQVEIAQSTQTSAARCNVYDIGQVLLYFRVFNAITSSDSLLIMHLSDSKVLTANYYAIVSVCWQPPFVVLISGSSHHH